MLSRLSLRPSGSSTAVVGSALAPLRGSVSASPLSALGLPQAPRRHHGHGHGGGHGHSHGRMSAFSDPAAQRAAQRCTSVGLASDVGLVVVKGVAGVATHSSALIGDAVHSLSDVLLSAITHFTTRFAAGRPDARHPWGRGKADSLGSLAISTLLVGAGLGISKSSAAEVLALLRGETPVPLVTLPEGAEVLDVLTATQAAGVGIGVCALVVGLKEWLFRWSVQVGMRVRSQALIANAWHHRADSWSSLVAAVGIGGSLAGFPALDPLAAVVVGGMIAKAGLETGYSAVRELMDERLDDDVVTLAADLARDHPQVLSVHRVRARRIGPSVAVEMELAVCPVTTVKQANDVAEKIRGSLFRERPEVSECLISTFPGVGSRVGFDEEAAAAAAASASGSSGGVGGRAAAGAGTVRHGHGHGAAGGHGHSHGGAASAHHHHEHEHDDDDDDHHDDHDDHDHEHHPAVSLPAVTERVRGLLLSAPHVTAVSHLDVHAETATSTLLHVHARLVLDPSIQLEAALASLRAATAAVEALRVPLHGDDSSGAGGGHRRDAAAWSVVEADVTLETSKN